MATAADTGRFHHKIPGTPARKFVTRLARAADHAWSVRSPRPWLAVIASPLAMVATAETGQWWAWPVLLLCSAGWSPAEPWMWVLALEEAVVGSEWTFVGSSSLASFRAERPLVAALWIGFPAVLAGIGWWAHRRGEVPPPVRASGTASRR